MERVSGRPLTRGYSQYAPSLHIAAGSAGNVTLASHGRFLAGSAVSAAEPL
jgi:hypothetical protein